MDIHKYSKHDLMLMEESVVPLAVYEFVDNRVLTVLLSDGFLESFGYGDRKATMDLMDNDMYRDAHPDDVARVSEAGVRFAMGGDRYEAIYRSKIDGNYHIVHSMGEHITCEGQRYALIWYVDEGEYDPDSTEYGSELDKMLNSNLRAESIVRKTQYDHLTGLPSMTHFFDIANSLHKSNKSKGITSAMLFFDMNGMKYFNRKYGLSEGDELIRMLGRLLVSHFGSQNCSRFGQDHFAVCTEEDGLIEKIESILKESAQLNEGKSLPLRVGIYYDNFGDVSASTACDWAKMACDIDRKSYKSQYHIFDGSMLRAVENHQYIVDKFDRALEEGWIQVYCQPIVRAASRKVCDEEGLCRWIDPEKGLLTPDQFIPVLEDSNLIYKLDLYMTEQILAKMKKQEEDGLIVVPMSVNLSRSDFDSCDIVEEIRKRVEAAGVSPDMLTIEITESIVGSDFEYMKEQVRRFQELGFKVWMDDFGSGYSSPDILQTIKFDLIKLDMRFMENFENGDESKIILTQLTRMAMALGIETVVEGVETKEQVGFLSEIGVTKLQGFYFSKPIPYDEIKRMSTEGEHIGYENPIEKDYFVTLGRVNLYDFSMVVSDDVALEDYFDTTPMAILEINGTKLRVIRGNKSYREFFTKHFRPYSSKRTVEMVENGFEFGRTFLNSVLEVSRDGGIRIFNEQLLDLANVHILIRRIAVNPVSKVTALALAILGVTENDMI